MITSLAKIQSEIEDFEGSILAVLGEQRTSMYHDTYYFRGQCTDELTTTEEYEKAVSQITRKPFSLKLDRKKYVGVTFS